RRPEQSARFFFFRQDAAQCAMRVRSILSERRSMAPSHETISTAQPKKAKARKPRRKPALGREVRETMSHMLAILRSGGDSRHRKVRRLRAAIKVRAYEN